MINITLFESLVTERDFLDKKFPDHHNVINVLANDGKLYRYHRYAGERELLTKIAETPIRFVDKTQLVERRQIVPGGVRVPMQLLKDIETFFRAFMIGLTAGFDATPDWMRRYRATEVATPLAIGEIVELSGQALRGNGG